MIRPFLTMWWLAALLLIALAPASAFARAMTRQVAFEGRPVTAAPNWPDGLTDVLNDPARTDGWRDIFSEWPSDVVHYQFRLTDTEQANALLKKFAAVDAEELHVRLSPSPEPRELGWVTSLPPGNGTAAMISLGDQQRVDEWFGRLPDGKFGVMEFVATPVAVLPTLTLYTGNAAIDLDRLEIPAGLEVSIGEVPRVFHEWNTRRVKDAPRKPELDEVEPAAGGVAEDLAKRLDEIRAFLAEREGQLGKDEPRRGDREETLDP